MDKIHILNMDSLITSNDFVFFLFSDGDFNFMWFFVIIGLWIVGLFMLQKRNKIKLESTKRLYLGYAVFAIVYGFSRIFFIFANYYYENGMENTSAFELHTRFAYLFGLLSIAFFIFGLERFFFQTKGLITLLPAITIILVITLPHDSFRVLNYFVQPVYLLIIMSLYIYIIKKSTGDVRKKAINASISFIIIFVGIFLDSRLFKGIFSDLGARWFVYIFSPILVLIGIFMLYLTNFNTKSGEI
jgi:hypothetical protein